LYSKKQNEINKLIEKLTSFIGSKLFSLKGLFLVSTAKTGIPKEKAAVFGKGPVTLLRIVLAYASV
jgi:hypothetical protein